MNVSSVADVVLLGLIAIGVPAFLIADDMHYKGYYIPASSNVIREEVRGEIDLEELKDGEPREWFAPDVITENCGNVYYGCLDWEKFSGSKSILTNRNDPGGGFGIEIFRVCPSEANCIKIDGFEAVGVEMSREEFFRRLATLKTVETCKVVQESWHGYRTERCKRRTSLNEAPVFDQYLVRYNQSIVGRMFILFGVPEYIYDSLVLVNFATRQVYDD